MGLSELKAGMRLIRGVLSPQGALLAKPGDELTDKQLRLFRMWGVVEAEVEGAQIEADAGDAIAGAVETDSIDELFAKHLDNAVMFQIATFAKELVSQRG